MKQYITAPNCITASRIIGAICLIFTQPFSYAFYIIYTLCGVSDALDGFVARMTKKTSEFGKKLDSVSDLIFYAVLLLKIFPFLWENLPTYVWIITISIILIRICAYMTALIKYKQFASLHTYANKLTGLSLFLVPYFVKIFDVVAVCIGVCIVAFVASLEELIIHIKSKEYSGTEKSIVKQKSKSI